MSKRKILYLPSDKISKDILSRKAIATLESLGEVIWNDKGREYTAEEVMALLPGAEGVVTSWGSPAFTNEMLAVADKLRIVGHAAGSIKHLMVKEGYDRGIYVLSAATVLAESVAEYTIWAMLSMQRDLFRYDHRMRVERTWRNNEDGWGHELLNRKVGIIAASMVGRKVIELLKPWGCDILVFDPYLKEDAAAAMGVRKAGLEELMSTCEITSIHAPITPETHHMIKAEHFRSMPDNALLINSARSWVTDEEAMVAELKTGRIRAMIDVFDEEPLPANHPLRDMPNVFLTPHVAGATIESRSRMVEVIANDFVRYFEQGEKPKLAVSWERLQIMA